MILYNKYLDIFICVADEGSFSKASQKLFISPNAVMKQINNFEDQLQIKLFNRTNHGLTLTPAGKVIYDDAHFMIQHSQATLAKARSLMPNHNQVVRIGSSLMRPSQQIIQLWQSINQQHPEIKIQVVPFSDQHDAYLQTVTNLGQKIDIIYGIFPSNHFNHRCQVLQLGQQRLACGVPNNHPLAKKKQLRFPDLDGQKLVMIKRGDTSYLDQLRDEIENHHPKITIIDVDQYDVSTLNYCEANNLIMITAEMWQNVHPGLVTIPVDWDFTVPYGLLYPLRPNQAVHTFINEIRQNYSEN